MPSYRPLCLELPFSSGGWMGLQVTLLDMHAENREYAEGI